MEEGTHKKKELKRGRGGGICGWDTMVTRKKDCSYRAIREANYILNCNNLLRYILNDFIYPQKTFIATNQFPGQFVELFKN